MGVRCSMVEKYYKKSFEELSKEEIIYWNQNLAKFKKSINAAKFGAIILDYDGTLCTNEERRKLPSSNVIQTLSTFLEKGFVIGIVTGRGKSVRENLVKCIDQKYWPNIIVGYYNGAIVAPLAELQPDVTANPKRSLKLIHDKIVQHKYFGTPPTTALRPLQLTIEKSDKGDWNLEKFIVLEIIANLQLKDIQVLESGHSIDVIAKPEVSKLNIINYCIAECSKRNISENYVCIGDKGMYPGNDYELLQSKYSLSVDEVSSASDTCWNLSNLGENNVSSCLHYLTSVEFNKSFFTLSL